MKIYRTIGPAVLGFSIIALGVVISVPWVFAGRILPGTYLAHEHVGGISYSDSSGVIRQYEQSILQKSISLTIRQKTQTYTLQELGVFVDQRATSRALEEHSWWKTVAGKPVLQPVVDINDQQLQTIISRDFSTVLQTPRNASLKVSATGGIETVSSRSGESIDREMFKQEITERLISFSETSTLIPHIVTVPPRLTEKEIVTSRQSAKELLKQGMVLSFGDKEWVIKPFTLRRLLTFREDLDQVTGKYTLVTQLKEIELEEYLKTTIAPEIDQAPQDARFEVVDGKVSQFAIAQEGYALDLKTSARVINKALLAGQHQVFITVNVTQPEIQASSDIESRGINTLLAKGESDFVGSPSNRIHNIRVGTSRYHGILIPPDTEFSFNGLLGPVTAEAGFKPELVIKKNVTVPEFGGGLCQVSTTIFRAAVQAGLKVTARRNHAYVVKYYGKPGFDATIYPPYTDLRFKNDTPNYILIQTHLEGTHLAMEFWGTSDNRQVEIIGPSTYDAKPDGSVKAVLKQVVKKDGAIVHEESFYSRYRSPQLFPKVSEFQPTPTPTPKL